VIDPDRPEPRRFRGEPTLPGGLTLRALIPNAITSAALCCGLTGIRFAIQGNWEKAVLAVILAGMLDGIDGRIARLLKAQSRFGAELDSLADAISFGVAPALIVFLWSLQDVARLGWFAALAFAIACASPGSTPGSTWSISRTSRPDSSPAFPHPSGPVSPSYRCICGSPAAARNFAIPTSSASGWW
jgi:hypothetical protein